MKNLIETLKTIPFIARFFQETPEYWKKVRSIAVTIVVIAGVILGLPSAFEQIGLNIIVPQIILTICGYIVAIGTTLGIAASNTVKDKPEVNG